MGKSKNKKTKPKSVLLTRFSALGDVALTIPVVYDAARSNPDVEFIFVTRPAYCELFIDPPANLRLVGIDFNDYRGLPGLWRLFRKLRREYPQVDFMADLHDVIRTKILRCLYSIHGVRKEHIDKGRKQKRALTRKTNKAVVQLTPTVERYIDTLERGGITTTGRFQSLFESDKREVKHPKSEFWLAIAPFAKHPGKVYPHELMEKVVAHFGRRQNTRVFLFGGGADEESILERWAQRYPNCENIAKLHGGLSTELRLIGRCDTMLAMDSANMHMAAICGVRTVSIWGATHPYGGFGPWRQNPKDALQVEMVCRPCSIYGNKPCSRGDFLCLHAVKPKMVIQAIERSAGNSSPSPEKLI